MRMRVLEIRVIILLVRTYIKIHRKDHKTLPVTRWSKIKFHKWNIVQTKKGAALYISMRIRVLETRVTILLVCT